MNGTILVGIDGSAACNAAIRWAIERAAATGQSVELLHVIDDEWGMIGEQFEFELHPSSELLLREKRELARSIDPSVTVATRLVAGDPMVELAAASRDAALTVVGTHKTGYLRGRAFGSRSLQLAATAWSPVAVIPERSSTVRHGIVAGVDDSAAGWAAVSVAADEAVRTGQELVLLQAWRVNRPGPADAEDAAEERARFAVARLGETALAVARNGRENVWARGRAVRRAAAEALVDASMTAELLVIGSSRRHGADQSALGPVSHDVLLNIAGPTLIVHGESATTAQSASTDRPATTARREEMTALEHPNRSAK
jgi:nucleotide-binding universal stress UspA family protein